MECARSLLRVAIALVLLLCCAAAAPSSNPAASKLPVPDAAALRSARAHVNDIFRKEISAAKKPGDKSKVAKELLHTAEGSADDAAARYAALVVAHELAAADGDADTALAAITGLDAFAVDGVKLKADTIAAILKSTASPQDTLVGPVIEEAIDADRFPVARQLAEAALSTAKSAADASAIANANAWVQQVREIEAASSAANKAANTLLTKPADPAACTTVGRYEAFEKNRWDKGLALLASGNDATLKSIAQNELGAPADGAQQAQVANGWWEISEKERGIAQSHIREHAAHWYKKALPGLNGLEKAKAEKRIKEGAVVRSMYTGWIDLLRKVNVQSDVTRGKCTLERGTLSLTTRALLKIAPKPQNSYALRIEYVRPDANESGASLGIVLPIGETELGLHIAPKSMGLEFVDGKRWFANDAIIRKGEFGGAKKKHLVEVTVWQDDPRILVVVDGKPQLEWKGTLSQLSTNTEWAFQPHALGIGTWDQAIAITGLAFREAEPESH